MAKLPSVLLVDDDPTTNFLNKLLLGQMAVAEEVLVAENGAEALRWLAPAGQLAEAACPALILLDINMPIMNGLAFLEAYQHLALPLPPPPPVIIVLTTSMHQPELTRLRTLPIAGILSKPLTREKVLGILQAHFSA